MTAPAVTSDPHAEAGPRILLVDDEEGIRNALSRFLTRRGFQVKTAADGQTALELLQCDRVDLMICDLRMPGMSGMEVTASALAIDAALAVIMLTGTNEATTAADVRRIGAADYLMKPIELVELSAAIDRALALRKSRMQAGAVVPPALPQTSSTRQSDVPAGRLIPGARAPKVPSRSRAAAFAASHGKMLPPGTPFRIRVKIPAAGRTSGADPEVRCKLHVRTGLALSYIAD